MGPNNGESGYVVTGPTSGIGLHATLELAKHGTVVLVGRDRRRLTTVQTKVQRLGGRAVPIVCDVSDLDDVRRAAEVIATLDIRLVGLLNNAGIMQMRETRTARGLDTTFATNYLGPVALTDALVPHLPDGANVLFTASAVEDPDRKPAVTAGFRGGRYISVEASARGEWQAGGSVKPGFDAYATSKQCLLAAAMAFARETPRLHFRAIEPGFTPATALGRDAGVVTRTLSAVLLPVLVPLLMPFIRILNTPQRAGRLIAKVMLDTTDATGGYYDERGEPMRGSALVHDTTFQDQLMDDTRSFVSAFYDAIGTARLVQ